MEEHETLDAEEAVKVALSKAIPEISLSSLTTISGMVAMMLMQFRLGYDMGIILVKAIILSLISVFFLMPGVLLIFVKGIDKTHHKCYVPKITIVGKFANKTKYIIPPLFIICLVFAFMKSNNCQYIYDTSSIVSAKKSESKIAQETIEETFGAGNQLVVMVPKGDYESEHKVVKKLQNLDYVTSALALSNVSINDEYVLTDKLSPRQFSELVGIDREVVEVLYMAYAYNQEQCGPVVTGIDYYDVPIIDMFLFLYDQYKEGYVTLDSNLDEELTTLYDTLHDAQLQLQGSDYSRLVLNISLPVEGQETYDALEEIRGITAQYYSKDSVIFVGNSTSDHDLESSFASDNIIISVLTALFVMIILFFTFQPAGVFKADGNVIDTKNIAYNANLGVSELPSIPDKDGYYAQWPENIVSKPILQNTVVEAEYHVWIESVAGDIASQNDKPLFIAEGKFYDDNKITLSKCDTDNLSGDIEYSYAWKMRGTDVKDEGTKTCHFYIKNTSGSSEVWYRDNADSGWVKADAKKHGSYMTAEIPYEADFAVIHKESSNMIYYICGGAAACIIVIAVIIIKKRKKRNK